MDSRVGAAHVMRRVAARAAAGVWRSRRGLLLAGVVAAGLTGYTVITGAGGALPSAAPGSAGPGPGSDCADTAMAAIADKSTGAAHRAYQCMDPAFQQRVSEAEFVRQIQAQRAPSADKLARVGDYHAPGGGSLVYYALDGGGQSVGYIVYLDANGRVLRIE